MSWPSGSRVSFSARGKSPRYHANWAVFVNGERLDLSSDRYMEEVAACGAGHQVLPTQRVHMHGNDDDVVDVHQTL